MDGTRTVAIDDVALAVLIPQAELEARVRELAREMVEDLRGEDPILVGVLDGAFVFLADLIRSMPIPLRCDFVRVSSYGDRTSPSGAVKIEQDIRRSLAGEMVVIVEDVVDTGGTMEALRGHIARRGPRGIKVCALLHKPSRTARPLRIDYLGFTIPDRFVVGYGLDLAGRHRGLPYVGAVET